MTSTDDTTVPAHLWKYALAHDQIQKAATQLRHFLQAKMQDSAVFYLTIDSRAKSIVSYRNKSIVQLADNSPKYLDPGREIQDTVAARILVYTASARSQVREIIYANFKVVEEVNPGEKKKNGYDSDHFIVTDFNDTSSVASFTDLKEFFRTRPALEIQVRTVAGHAWAEYEHDIRYKPGNGYEALSIDGKDEVDRLFTDAGAVRESLDEKFEAIEQILFNSRSSVESSSGSAKDNSRISARVSVLDSQLPTQTRQSEVTRDTLITILQMKYPESVLPTASELDEQIDILKAMDLTDVRTLENALDSVDSEDVQRLMGYRSDPGALRRLEDDLLARFGDEYVSTVGLTSQMQFNLQGRLRRIRGKLLIYSVDNIPRLKGQFFTTSQLFRELSKETSRSLTGTMNAGVEGLSSNKKSGLDAATRPRRMKVPYGHLWFATNRSRGALERGSITLAKKLPGHVILRRAGDVFYPES